jgi:hypothetical protein
MNTVLPYIDQRCWLRNGGWAYRYMLAVNHRFQICWTTSGFKTMTFCGLGGSSTASTCLDIAVSLAWVHPVQWTAPNLLLDRAQMIT